MCGGGKGRPSGHCESFGPAALRASIQSGPAEGNSLGAAAGQQTFLLGSFGFGFLLNSVLESALLCIVLLP